MFLHRRFTGRHPSSTLEVLALNGGPPPVERVTRSLSSTDSMFRTNRKSLDRYFVGRLVREGSHGAGSGTLQRDSRGTQVTDRTVTNSLHYLNPSQG